MWESINLVFHAWIVIERIVVKVAELRGVPLQIGALERYSNVGFHKSSVSKSDKALNMLYKEHNIPIVQTFFYQNHLPFFICSIEMGVKVA